MITASPAVHSVRQEFMEGKPMIIFKKSKTEKVDFFKQPYDGVTMRGRTAGGYKDHLSGCSERRKADC